MKIIIYVFVELVLCNVYDKEDCKDKSIQSHYFIKIKSMVNNKISFNIVGTKSISKQKLNKIYNKINN